MPEVFTAVDGGPLMDREAAEKAVRDALITGTGCVYVRPEAMYKPPPLWWRVWRWVCQLLRIGRG